MVEKGRVNFLRTNEIRKRTWRERKDKYGRLETKWDYRNKIGEKDPMPFRYTQFLYEEEWAIIDIPNKGATYLFFDDNAQEKEKEEA